MKFHILSVCVAMVAADVSHILPKQGKDETQAKILKQELDVGVEGQYQWAYETKNGISASESGSLKNAGSENAANAVQGAASRTSPNGEVIQVTYIADKHGYQPQENAASAVQGAASRTSPNGKVIQRTYIADKHGYQPQSFHIPTSPPTPEYIVRALQYIMDHPPMK